MKDPIKLIKIGWKTGAIVVVVTTMVFGGLFLNIKAASATNAQTQNQPAPNMTIRHEGLIGSSGNLSHSVTLNSGDEVQFYAEIHNTVVGSTANHVRIKDAVTGGNFTDGTSVATASADNANSASDTVNIHINGGGRLDFIEHSTRLTWDVNGDGIKEYDLTHIAGNPMSSDGILIGNQHGCNQYIIQVYWMARVTGGSQPSPTPSPTPTPTPAPPASPSPSPGESINITNNNNNNNTNNNTQNQTVNVTGTVAGVSVPAKQPETGVSVLGLTSMAGAAPIGYLLSRFGRGRITNGKKEESLEEVAMGIFTKRSGKNQDA